MAKATKSPLNMWRGKAGSMVYRVRNGVQVVSALQSSVSNPRTDAQLAQRARFNLMTGLNRITPIDVLRGYAGTPAQKRAAFAKDLSKYITAQYVAPSGNDAGKFIGTIAPANIHFDKLVDSLFKNNLSATVIDDLNNTVGVHVGFKTGDMPDIDGFILRCIDVYGPSGAPISVMYKDIVGGQSLDFEFEGAGRHRIYAQVLVPTDALPSVAGNAPVNEQLVNVNIVSNLTGATTNYTMGHCIYINSHVVAEPQP